MTGDEYSTNLIIVCKHTPDLIQAWNPENQQESIKTDKGDISAQCRTRLGTSRSRQTVNIEQKYGEMSKYPGREKRNQRRTFSTQFFQYNKSSMKTINRATATPKVRYISRAKKQKRIMTFMKSILYKDLDSKNYTVYYTSSPLLKTQPPLSQSAN